MSIGPLFDAGFAAGRAASADEIERLNNLLKQMRSRAGNLATLLESAAADATNIQMPGLFVSLTPEQQKAAPDNKDVDV